MLRGRGPYTTERGQGLMEYSLIILLVVLVVFGGLIFLGPVLVNVFSTIHTAL